MQTAPRIRDDDRSLVGYVAQTHRHTHLHKRCKYSPAFINHLPYVPFCHWYNGLQAIKNPRHAVVLNTGVRQTDYTRH